MDSCDVHEMLSQFTNTESLGRVYSCAFCKSNQRLRRKQVFTDAEKRLEFSKIPLVLIVHFKRFRWFGRTGREKINAHVNFPLELDLSGYMSAGHSDDPTYTLQAVVRHHGSGFSSGHYTAYCWNYTTQFWMHFNDAKAERCSEDEVLHTQAYILFYVRKNLNFDKLGSKIIGIVRNSNWISINFVRLIACTCQVITTDIFYFLMYYLCVFMLFISRWIHFISFSELILSQLFSFIKWNWIVLFRSKRFYDL